LKSKVESMYGDSIKEMILDMSKFYGLKMQRFCVKIMVHFHSLWQQDLSLRLKINSSSKKRISFPIIEQNLYSTKKDQLRRSRLYLPGNEPKFFVNAGLHSPDGIILDLEDSVAPSEKDAAQLLVRNALRSVDFYGAERMVRINQLPKGFDDLKYIIPNNVNVILVPKCESSEQIHQLEKEVEKLKKQFKVTTEIYFMPIVESALGVIKAYEIASASKIIVLSQLDWKITQQILELSEQMKVVKVFLPD